MYKTILFDLDDTIFDFKKSERCALIKTFCQLGIEPSDDILSRYSVINQQQWKRLELGEISREQVKVGRYKLLFDEYGIDEPPEKTTAIYENNLAEGHYFIDGAVEMLEELYKNFSLYLVSNGAKKVQDGRLADSGISHFFKNIFISEVIGFEKPSKDFFDYCFNKIPNVDKSCTIIIGDSLSSDIKGGKNAGISTMWFNPHHQVNDTDIIPDYEISSLSEIKAFLNG
ncbi:MAG: YjjG family noncanonical pyrimidine nucleotidase [Acetobacter sp.]|nr:YjjG family noncanonical pyrimidine nucleotidase [Bacteroides sp.]MCM1341066.1 YjjG family noncanonical pyrimidine nucleotidase [Acetobacter sp.]MCM1433601.1 YjjG family noncanonical pyrimidine nucleotidase [Clostridiales bacterium]